MLAAPKQILWPTDFSELSLHAGRYAWGMLKQSPAARLHILHLIPPPMGPDVAVVLPAEMPVPVSEPGLIDAAKRGMQQVVARHFEVGSNIQIDARFAIPWRGICDYAREHKIELIVISTHGRTGIGHAVIGSTAERVVQHAPCPVLVVKRSDTGMLYEGGGEPPVKAP